MALPRFIGHHQICCRFFFVSLRRRPAFLDVFMTRLVFVLQPSIVCWFFFVLFCLFFSSILGCCWCWHWVSPDWIALVPIRFALDGALEFLIQFDFQFGFVVKANSYLFSLRFFFQVVVLTSVSNKKAADQSKVCLFGRGVAEKKGKKNEARKRSNCVGKENDAEREMKSSPTRHFVFWSTTQLKEGEEQQQQLVEETEEKKKRQTKKSEEQKRRKRKEEMQLRPGNRTCKGSRTNVARHTQSRVITPVRREKKKRGKQNKINENDRNSHMKTSEGTWQHLLFARCPPREQSNQVFDDYFPSRRKPSKSTQKPVEPRVI